LTGPPGLLELLAQVHADDASRYRAYRKRRRHENHETPERHENEWDDVRHEMRNEMDHEITQVERHSGYGSFSSRIAEAGALAVGGCEPGALADRADGERENFPTIRMQRSVRSAGD
jgi:hypothetical protein